MRLPRRLKPTRNDGRRRVIEDVTATHCWRSVRNDRFKDKEKNTNKKIKGNTKKKAKTNSEDVGRSGCDCHGLLLANLAMTNANTKIKMWAIVNVIAASLRSSQ